MKRLHDRDPATSGAVTRRRPSLAACLALAAVSWGALPAVAAAAEVGKPAADFSGKTLTGATTRLSNYRGKVVLIDFWASWCEPCKKELPRLADIAHRLRSRGIEVLTVNIDAEKGKAKEFLDAAGVQLPVVLDPDGVIAGKYDPPKMPTSFVVDRAGVIRYVNASYQDGDEKKIERQLLELAAKPVPPQ